MTADRAIRPRLTLGPLLYYWPRDKVFELYEAAARWPVASVYLGETVCGKRHEMRFEDWCAIARALASHGKEVVFSTCELIESESDLRVARRLAANGEFLVEANDLSALRLLADRGVPFVAGACLNLYSRASLELVRGLGATRWVMPLELGAKGLAEILRGDDIALETEVFAHGRLPLAVSARCFTARYSNQSKDDCGFRCIEHPDGLQVATQDGQPFLALNGLQTQSAAYYDLARELPAMAALGVDFARVSPQSRHTAEVVRIFGEIACGALDPAQGAKLVEGLHAPACDGYWYARPGIERVACVA